MPVDNETDSAAAELDEGADGCDDEGAEAESSSGRHNSGTVKLTRSNGA